MSSDLSMDLGSPSKTIYLFFYKTILGYIVQRVKSIGHLAFVRLYSSSRQFIISWILLVNLYGWRSGLQSRSVPVSQENQSGIVLELLEIVDYLSIEFVLKLVFLFYELVVCLFLLFLFRFLLSLDLGFFFMV